MKSVSSEINKVFTRTVRSALVSAGFSKTMSRRSWKWLEDCIWVFEIHSVGSYFSDVTGWPPMSVVVNTGIFYEYVPPMTGRAVKRDNNGQLLPAEVECHSRSQLTCTSDQSALKKNLRIPEQKRNDIWWIERDLSNIENVAENICLRFKEQGLPWYQKLTIPANLLRELEERSCYYNWFIAMHLSQKMGLNEKFEEYRSKVIEYESNPIF